MKRYPKVRRGKRSLRLEITALEIRSLLTYSFTPVVDPSGTFHRGDLTPVLAVAADALNQGVPLPDGANVTITIQSTPGLPGNAKGIARPRPVTPIYFPREHWRDGSALKDLRSGQATNIVIQVDPSYLNDTKDVYVGADITVPANHEDFVTAIERETMHALGFVGYAQPGGGYQNSGSEFYGSAFDHVVTGFPDGVTPPADPNRVFPGGKAMTANGGVPVPVAPVRTIDGTGDNANTEITGAEVTRLYYLANPVDLMAAPPADGSVFSPGGRRFPSAVDAGILADVTGGTSEFRTSNIKANVSDASFSVKVGIVGPGGPFTVVASTADGSAFAGRDYTATSKTFTLQQDQGDATFTVPIKVDPRLYSDRTLRLNLKTSSGTPLDSIVVTLHDNRTRPPGDYDGDGKTDLAIYSSSLGVFAERPSSGGPDVIGVFGPAGYDFVAVPGDYDGDGKNDFAIYSSSFGVMAYRPSRGGPDVITRFGPAGAGFVPAPGDYDGDGKADFAIYSAQYGVFAYKPSSGGSDVIGLFGPQGFDFTPAPGDYDGDRKTDLAIYSPTFGVLAYRPSSGGKDSIGVFGPANGGFMAAPGDYDGDGKTDLAIYSSSFGVFAYRPSTGGADRIGVFGPAGSGFTVAPGDYDGDHKTDPSVYSPGFGVFAVRPSSGGPDRIGVFGPSGYDFTAVVGPPHPASVQTSSISPTHSPQSTDFSPFETRTSSPISPVPSRPRRVPSRHSTHRPKIVFSSPQSGFQYNTNTKPA